MSGSFDPPVDGSPSPRRGLPSWLLGLAGVGLFLAGGALGAVLMVSITLYRAPTASAAPTPTVELATAAPRVAPSPPAVPTALPTSTRLRVGPAVGQEAPAFTLAGLDQKEYSLIAYRGRTVLVLFWASWCPPCRQEWPELRAFVERHSSLEVIVLAVNVEDPLEVVQKFVGDEGSSFPVLLDSDGSVSERYHVGALPTTFVVDRQGIVRQVLPGNMDVAAMERLLER